LAILEIDALIGPVDSVQLHIYLKTTTVLSVWQWARLASTLPLFTLIVRKNTLLIVKTARFLKQLS